MFDYPAIPPSRSNSSQNIMPFEECKHYLPVKCPIYASTLEYLKEKLDERPG